MAKIVGFDLGTNSVGTAVRNTVLGEELEDQLEYFSVDIFNSGVGNNKNGEYSYAAERSKGARQRRLYDVRRRRRWETLKYLIENNCCPLSREELITWKTYDKKHALTRQYPINNKEFMDWVRMDFNHDGVSDCTPLELRFQLVNRQFDFTDPTERFRLGRAIFHICQHRGFRSSKGETLASQENEEMEDIDLEQEMKKSEQKKSCKLVSFKDENGCKTVGEALRLLEKTGMRIRGSEYQAVRSQLKDEITEIFKFQNGLDIESDFYKHLTSEKKNEGCIFYKNPLRSQKGLIGHCTLEPQKQRCPISHPDYEKYRAYSFIANIKVRRNEGDEWMTLDVETKNKIYEKCFFVYNDFKFEKIRKELEKTLGFALSYEPNRKGTVNYKDSQTVCCCPISARLKAMLGDDWKNIVINGKKERNSKSKIAPQRHTVTYTAEDLWHLCFTADEMEDVEKFAINSLGWDEKQAKMLVKLWSSIKQGYAMLSRKAMRNITRMLELGFDNKDAILLAKIPEIVGIDKWESNENNVQDILVDYTSHTKDKHAYERTICNITNSLIARYKALPEQHIFAYKDVKYVLQESDYRDIDNAIIDYFGENTWSQMEAEKQEPIINAVRKRYQEFFATSKREFCKTKRLADYFSEYLENHLPRFDKNMLKLLYHPSMAEFPTEYDGKRNKERSEWRLGSPKLGGIRNPVALRTLHTLRRKVNAMLDNGIIDPETTRVVIETTHEINDANMRWAIEQYQHKRKRENEVIKELLKEFISDRDISNADYDKVNCYMAQAQEQGTIVSESLYGDNRLFPFTGKKEKQNKDEKNLVLKYKLWKQQGGICLYTGRTISFASLFSGDEFDIEHTLPRSKSFDDSQSNLTICDAHYNRAIKKNMLPTEMANYSENATINGVTYTAIKPRLEAWEKRVEKLKDNIEFWIAQSRKATDKGRKDDCIRQRHLWKMELEFWQDKLSRFKATEIPEGFRHRQIADTGVISRYAVLYLKSVFQNVEVQKGIVTDAFKKILGIQSLEEKKDRSLHSHHAIDAAILTMIPTSAAKRDTMLKLFYEREENKYNDQERERLTRELSVQVNDCHLGKSAANIGEYITSNILINHLSKETVFTPSCKKWKNRGKDMLFKQADGKMGTRRKTGDAIRGSLHKDSFYGAILYPMIEEESKKTIVKDGKFVYKDDATPRMVSRVNISSFSSIDSLDTIVDFALKEDIKTQIVRRMRDGKTFNAARDEGLWQLDKNGNEIKTRQDGTAVNPIRHIRTFVKAGRGFLTFEKVIQLKQHTLNCAKTLRNISNRDHKNHIYVSNEENCMMLLYATIVRGKLKRAGRILNLIEASKVRNTSPNIKNLNDIANEPYYQTLQKNKEVYALYATLLPGTRVLAWKEKCEELYDMSVKELTTRLYYVKKFNNKGTAEKPSYTIYLQPHIKAEEDISSYTPQDFNFLIEGVDFEFNELGELIFTDKQ